jgi:hypothetical protein
MKGKDGWVEVRRKGMRYLAKSRNEAVQWSLPSDLYPEDPGTPYTIKLDTLKKKACQSASKLVPGVSKANYWKARELTKAALTFGEIRRKDLFQDWRSDMVIQNMAEFLHFQFNVLGFSRTDEMAVLKWAQENMEWGKH